MTFMYQNVMEKRKDPIQRRKVEMRSKQFAKKVVELENTYDMRPNKDSDTENDR